MFFQTYGSMTPREAEDNGRPAEGESLSAAREASARVAEGGYAEALSRAGHLLSAKGRRLPLTQLEMKKELMARLGHLLPRRSPEEIRVIRGNQDVICPNEPDGALNTLPVLLSDSSDREKSPTVLDAVVTEYSKDYEMSREQRDMLRRIQEVLSAAEILWRVDRA